MKILENRIKGNGKRWQLLLLLLIMFPSQLFTSCDDAEDSIYRGHACYFIFDTTLHPLPCQLTSAMGNTGHFLKVSTSLVSGVRHIKTIRNYDGATEDIRLETKRENDTRCMLGANNAIIIGRSNYTNMLVCYEGQCANCLIDFGGTNYPLTWTANGQQLACARCHRTYDVNNGVVATGKGGHQLYNYKADFSGDILRAWN